MQIFQGSSRLRPPTCAFLALGFAAFSAHDLNAGDLPALPAVPQAEAEGAVEAQELLRHGDEAYAAGRYEDAMEAYAGVRELAEAMPGNAEWRLAVRERWAQASVEYAKARAKFGDYRRANEALEAVLGEEGMPGYEPALVLQDQLKDPIRYNPALTPEHSRQVVEVARHLRVAEGHYELGEFDRATASYEAALRIDPYNVAARRGMERTVAAKTRAANAAYDHTRAELLAEVDAQWELQPSATVTFPDAAGSADLVASGDVYLGRKLDSIIIPRVDLEEAPLAEAIDFLRAITINLDTAEADPARRGIPFVVDLSAATEETANSIRGSRVNLRLANVPARQVLDYIAEQTRTRYLVDEFAIRVVPLGASSDRLITRTFRVAPDFISRQSASAAGATGAAVAANPFDEPEREGLLAERLTAREVLENLGVRFEAGATASFMGATSTLIVTNTPDMISLVEEIVSLDAQTEPVQVVLSVTMIRTEQTNLEELGYDWFLDEIASGSVILGGDAQQVTAGQRSGDFAIQPDSINGLIENRRTTQELLGAPGILSIDSRHLAGMLRGLDQKKGTDLISVPSVVARSGEQARIEVQREFIYPTEYEPPELPNSVGSGTAYFIIGPGGEILEQDQAQPLTPVTPATPTAFTMREVGTVLEVEPVVSPDRHYINLKLAPILTEMEGFINYGSPIRGGFQNVGFEFGGGGVSIGRSGGFDVLTENQILMPVFRTLKTETAVTVADGATLVFGSLQDSRVQNVEDSTPILGDLPVVGRLFQTKARQQIKTAVLFMVKVELVDPTGRPYRQR